MATDVPFWRKSTGAEQRMASLVRYLASDGFVVRTFYLGQTDSEQITSRDRDLIEMLNLDVEQHSSDQPPQHLANKIGWYANATKYQLQQWVAMIGQDNSDDSVNGDVESDSESDSEEEQRPPKLSEYRWPWAVSAFGESVRSFKPNSIIIQYIKLSYLLDALSSRQRTAINCLVDTHDVLHLRCQQFRERGFQHWIELTRDEESAELQKFDTIMAIQAEEACLFRDMAPNAHTIVCGHCVENLIDDRTVPVSKRDAQDRFITIGYLGSTNASNAHAIENFLTRVWPEVLAQIAKLNPQPRIRLTIAGGICQWLVQSDALDSLDMNLLDMDSVELLGAVADLATFYNRIDLVVNPVEFGSGLKIKNCEALSFGKPILTTPHGSVGLPPETATATLICCSSTDFVAELIDIASNANRLADLQNAATKLSQSVFSEQQAYSELKQSLLQAK